MVAGIVTHGERRVGHADHARGRVIEGPGLPVVAHGGQVGPRDLKVDLIPEIVTEMEFPTPGVIEGLVADKLVRVARVGAGWRVGVDTPRRVGVENVGGRGGRQKRKESNPNGKRQAGREA